MQSRTCSLGEIIGKHRYFIWTYNLVDEIPRRPHSLHQVYYNPDQIYYSLLVKLDYANLFGQYGAESSRDMCTDQ